VITQSDNLNSSNSKQNKANLDRSNRKKIISADFTAESSEKKLAENTIMERDKSKGIVMFIVYFIDF